jgi:hypothetical protein
VGGKAMEKMGCRPLFPQAVPRLSSETWETWNTTENWLMNYMKGPASDHSRLSKPQRHIEFSAVR